MLRKVAWGVGAIGPVVGGGIAIATRRPEMFYGGLGTGAFFGLLYEVVDLYQRVKGNSNLKKLEKDFKFKHSRDSFNECLIREAIDA